MNEPLLQRAKQHRCVRLGSLRGKTNFIGITGKKAPSSLDLPELWHPCRVCSLVIDRPFYGVPPPPPEVFGGLLWLCGVLGRFWVKLVSGGFVRSPVPRIVRMVEDILMRTFLFVSSYSSFCPRFPTSLDT